MNILKISRSFKQKGVHSKTERTPEKLISITREMAYSGHTPCFLWRGFGRRHARICKARLHA